ncbi:MAG: glycoside hydrolase family 3 N-terminal domain-containing protein [Gemmatimonadota bacterium]
MAEEETTTAEQPEAVDVSGEDAPDAEAGVEAGADADERAAIAAGARGDRDPLAGLSTDLPPGFWAEAVLARLTPRQRVAQLMMPFVLGDFAPKGSASHNRIVRMIEEEEVGGIIMSVGSPMEVGMKLNDLQGHAGVPLMVSADLETGAGFRMRGAVQLPGGIELGGATNFPSQMAVGATFTPTWAYEMGRITAIEARAVGIHMPFAPVLDVNNNPENPIINVRSFGEDPAAVAEMGIAYVRGMQEHGALATGKHFPGHGDTEADSHLELPIIRVSRDRLDAMELLPFQGAIDAGMGAVMTAHISIPSLTNGVSVPATLAPDVLTRLLRNEMGFGGLIITDAMDMNAIDRLFQRGEAAVRAVEAGADVLLMPPNPTAAINGIMTALESGRLTQARIDESVLRILRFKEEMGLHVERMVEPATIYRDVGIPEHNRIAQEIADASITLLKNDNGLLPLLGTRSADVLSVSYRRNNDILAGRYFNAHLRATYPRLRAEDVSRDTETGVYDRLLQRARQSNLVVVSTYVTALSYSGSVAIPEELSDFIKALVTARIPHIVVSFGNPYLFTEFPDAQAYMLAWSGAEVSQRAAARALFGEIPVRGRAPTRVPPFEIGAGIQLPTRARLGDH